MSDLVRDSHSFYSRSPLGRKFVLRMVVTYDEMQKHNILDSKVRVTMLFTCLVSHTIEWQ